MYQALGIGDRSKHATLHLNHLDGMVMVCLIGGATAVFNQHALQTPIIGVAHGGVHADIGGNARQYQISDAAGPEYQLQVGGIE